MSGEGASSRTVVDCVAVVLALLVLSGCSGPSAQDQEALDLRTACTAMVGTLGEVGLEFADLVPEDLSQVDGDTLAGAYEVGSQQLGRLADQTADVRVGEIIGTTSSTMGELAPLALAVASGSPTALWAARGPLVELGTIAYECSLVAMEG